MEYYCYMLVNDGPNTYIGITNDINKRIQQHNGLLRGGAKYTRRANIWRYHMIIGMFTKGDALRFEWRWKKGSGLEGRSGRAQELLKMDEWNNKQIINPL